MFPQGESGLLRAPSSRFCPDNLLPPICCYSWREGVGGGRCQGEGLVTDSLPAGAGGMGSILGHGLGPRGSLECNPEIPAFPGEEN